jgi:hypothetical protein
MQRFHGTPPCGQIVVDRPMLTLLLVRATPLPSGQRRLAPNESCLLLRGIGEGIVRRFVEKGAKVVFSDLLTEKSKTLEAELDPNAAFCRADATSPSDTEALMKFAIDRFGRLCRQQRWSGRGRRTNRRNVRRRF